MRRSMFSIAALCFAVALSSPAENAIAQSSLTYLHTLAGNDGQVPNGGLVLDSKGDLYGTTMYGGAPSVNCPFLDSCGTVFELSPDGSNGWTYQTLYSFTGAADGAMPIGDLVLDKLGNIYGTTLAGGTKNSANCSAQGCGTVFELSHTSGNWILTTLYSFSGSDGATPCGGLARDSAGRLYGGTTAFLPTLFVLTPLGSGWKFSTLHTGGSITYCGLTIGADGNLYGTASQSAACGNGQGCGVVFEVSRSAGKIQVSVLHIFGGYTKNDGAEPMGKLLIDSAGNIYGTTAWGGITSSSCGYGAGCGTVFKLSHSGTTWTEQILHQFDGTDGDEPSGDLALDSNGNLYGTTALAGTVCGQCGTVFELTPNGTSWQFQNLYNFSNVTGGWNPKAGIALDGSRNLFGTTGSSQPLGTYGTIFEIQP